MALYKALPSRYLESLLDGYIRFQSLAYYKQHEAQGTVGDLYEATRLFAPSRGLEIHNLTTNTRFTMPAAFLSEMVASEIFVFCMSQVYVNPADIDPSYDVSVELTAPRKFAKKLQTAAKALPGDWVVIARPVDYYDDPDPPGVNWALPDVIVTSKRQCFAAQAEYRFALARRKLLKIGAAVQKLQFGQAAAPIAGQLPDPLVLKVGSIRDLCNVAPRPGT